VGVSVGVAVGLSVGMGMSVGVGVCVGDAVAVAVGVSVGVGVPVDVAMDVGVYVGGTHWVGVGGSVSVGDNVPRVGVAEEGAVDVVVGVDVAVGDLSGSKASIVMPTQ